MEKRSITTYEQAVEYIYGIPKFTKKNSIEDTRAFLQKLENPDRKLRIIHVAGTNGKGSTCTYMRSILETAGYQVAVFTSPHLVDIRERFYIRGSMPSKDAFLQAFLIIYNSLDWEQLKEDEDSYHPTYFEYLFFMAMLLFAGEELDYCILETGLGGRLDATNSVSEKKLCVITSISLDHVEYLGNTQEAIAYEKAGIMRGGVPLVYSDTKESVSAVFEETARSLQTDTYPVSKNHYRNLKICDKSIDFSLQYGYDNDIKLTIPTIAVYQAENAALAVRAIEVLSRKEKLSITQEHIRQGLATSFWAGRMEEILPEVYVDGGHNEDGIRAFLDTVRQDGRDGRRKLLFSVVSDKAYGKMLRQLAQSGLFEEIAVARLGSYRAASLESLEQILLDASVDAYTLYDDVKSALCALLAKQKDTRIYAVGSLYLVGEMKELVENDQF